MSKGTLQIYATTSPLVLLPVLKVEPYTVVVKTSQRWLEIGLSAKKIQHTQRIEKTNLLRMMRNNKEARESAFHRTIDSSKWKGNVSLCWTPTQAIWQSRSIQQMRMDIHIVPLYVSYPGGCTFEKCADILLDRHEPLLYTSESVWCNANTNSGGSKP